MRVPALFLPLLLALPSLNAQLKVVVPANAPKPVGPYSPGLAGGAYLYVSGQGARDAKGDMPEGIEAQTRQCLENVRAILTAGGLTMAHVVSVQFYLADITALPMADRIYKEYFPKNPPARLTAGVTRIPTGSPIEITVVAVKDLDARQVSKSGIKVGGRLYLSAVYGQTMAEAKRALDSALEAAGYGPEHLVYTSRYQVGTSDPALIPIQSLPGAAKVALSAIAATRGRIAAPNGCAIDGDTAFCEVRGGTAPTVEAQTAEVLEATQAALAGAGFGLPHIAASNVYLANLDDFQKMNAKYATYFGAAPPTRTTFQPGDPGAPGPQFRLSVIAVR